MSSITKTEFNKKVKQALEAAVSYYDHDTILMADVDWDALMVEIQNAVLTNPDWETPTVIDLFTKVAAGASSGGTVSHPVPMLSLGKVKEMTDVADFIAKVGSPVVVETKLDGLAVRCEYVNGNLVLVATRGDGTTGEDVTAQAKNITGLPRTLKQPLTVEVRGEVFMTDEDFDTASANRVAAGKEAFANPRNATAGTLRNADLTYAAPMTFAAYDASGDAVDAHDSYLKRMAIIKKAGVQPAVSLVKGSDKTHTTAAEVEVEIDAIHEARPTLGFPIDGAVIKVDSIKVRETLGAASRTPRWAAAYKYPADTVTSILRDIEVSVGRTGRLGLRGVIDPVNVGGTTITYASVHNIPWVEESGILINGHVVVYRANDVIPRITAPLDIEQPKNAHKWTPPSTCPQCDEPLDTSSLLYRCTTPDCSVLGRIQYACHRDCWDIEGVGSEIALALVESELVNNIADLFDLTEDQIANTKLGVTDSGKDRLIGKTVAAKIHAEIEKAKSQPLNRTITALGIRKTGRTMGRRLAAQFHTMDALRAASVDDLMQVEGIARNKAEQIHKGLTDMSDILDRLAAAGVNMGEEPADVPAAATADQPFAGMTVVVSGSVPGLSRNEANEWVERLGGKSSGSVSKNTSLLVAGDGAGSKADKAASLGVRVMPAEEFAAMVAAAR